MDYQLSILIPSAYSIKLSRLLQNLKETMANFSTTEIVICLDGYEQTVREGNLVWCFSPPSKYRSTFHEKPALVATGRFMMMANDDIEFKTKNWDLMIPYHKYPDDWVLFYFKDDIFNVNFSCHPVFSRKVFELAPDILSPLYQVTKCDNTIWDIHPASRRVYLPEIELIHHHEGYNSDWDQAHRDDNSEYARNQDRRDDVRKMICKEIGMEQRVLIGVPTGYEVRRPEFYDYFNLLHRPPGTVCEFVHGPSIANNRNILIASAIQNDCSHLFFLDDDVICDPGIIFQLLKHDVDIVTAVMLGKSFPHRPYLFKEILDDHRFKYYKFNDVDIGLIPIMGSGFGAVLIKTEVFKKLEQPWIRYNPHMPDQLGEDLYFYDRLKETGIGIYCDLDCTVTHFMHAGVRPHKTKDGWIITYNTSGEGYVSFLHSEQEKVELI